jgi:hypothetical protein
MSAFDWEDYKNITQFSALLLWSQIVTTMVKKLQCIKLEENVWESLSGI